MTENIRVFRHNSIRIESEKGMIYVDPFKMDDAPAGAAYVLITHDHYDHFSPEDIEKTACGDTVLVVPEKMAGKAEALSGMVSEIITVLPGNIIV
ncbi:MAG: MBL fold metallo-hydrolase [Lachnospiraceae bacterium]|nr:MBL fold metallo-hydrolase [Lachnospiraceae bacterium]